MVRAGRSASQPPGPYLPYIQPRVIIWLGEIYLLFIFVPSIPGDDVDRAGPVSAGDQHGVSHGVGDSAGSPVHRLLLLELQTNYRQSFHTNH